MKFGYEDLDVWNKAVNFAVRVIDLVENMNTDRKHYRLPEQIESSSSSISRLKDKNRKTNIFT